MTSRAAGPNFWAVVVVLLGAARKRTSGRLRRQMKLQRMRGAWMPAAFPTIGIVLVGIVASVLHIGVAVSLMLAVSTAERVQAEAKGRVVVDEWFAGRIELYEAKAALVPAQRAEITRAENKDIAIEAAHLARENGGDAKKVEARLRATVRKNPKALLSMKSLWWQPGALPDVVALIVLLWWSLMLISQGEGPELDAQRQRNPMWEWLFSHPAPPAAIFLAEMIAPIAANPAFLAIPLLPGILFGFAYGWLGGLAGALLVGIPVALALACVGKAIEIRVVLRLAPRARGAVLGLMGWFGFASMVVFFFGLSSLQPLVEILGRWLAPFSDLPWPPTRMLLGRTAGGDYIFLQGLALCWLVAAILIIGSIAFTLASARHGLVGRAGSGAVATRIATPTWFGHEPLYRKEMLWFRRDGRAFVQAILIPLSFAALQTFNLRGLVSNTQSAWNTICGVAIVFGTYFLLVLGPKSLASEGQALWIAQTWPRGLESLLKAKAKLWALLATLIVELVLVYAAWRYPGDLVDIIIVGLLWWVFARSLAEKTVTLATVTSSSGEPEKIPAAQRWAATIGTLTFAIGIFTQQWSLAVTGVAYSILTAAAMWQNFRNRLPFLSDPWSETFPTPPTLLHAMVGITAMIESIAVLSAIAFTFLNRNMIAPVNAGLYGLCAIATALGLGYFLRRRGVRQREIWLWRDDPIAADPRPVLDLDMAGRVRIGLLLVTAALLGAALGLAAHAYLLGLHAWPDLARAIDEGRRNMDAIPNARVAYAVMAIGFAPLAEEFLFRGLLFRALDREWGGWKAVVGAGAFFAMYHPLLSWAPVAALGAMNAVIFKRTGRLAPAVAAHMAYNSVVLAF